MIPMHQTLVMPLQNGTQKEVGGKLGPDFRRDDGKGKVRDDGKGPAMTIIGVWPRTLLLSATRS